MTSQNEVNKRLQQINQTPEEMAQADFINCCGSQTWARLMTEARPFTDFAELLNRAEQIWLNLETQDWLEAFAAHPKIGAKKAVSHQSAQAAEWSNSEQSGTQTAADSLRDELETANRLYEEKFGFIFIVCATGKSVDEMLDFSRRRLKNDADSEIRIAAEEQRKITEIRLKKLLESGNWMSAITTHILDISSGFPARGIPVTLEKQADANWETVGRGVTDDDGRLRDLLDSGAILQAGNYRLIFDTEMYFAQQQIEGFYPQVTVAFVVRDAAQHFHVPLLLSPFGYSTYRGS